MGVKKSEAALNDHEHRMHKLNSFHLHNTEYTKYMTCHLRNIRHKLDNVIITSEKCMDDVVRLSVLTPTYVADVIYSHLSNLPLKFIFWE